MTTLDGSALGVIDEAAIAQLAAALRGRLIRRGDDAYEAARRVYSAMIDCHPPCSRAVWTWLMSFRPSTSPASTDSRLRFAAVVTMVVVSGPAMTVWSSTYH